MLPVQDLKMDHNIGTQEETLILFKSAKGHVFVVCTILKRWRCNSRSYVGLASTRVVVFLNLKQKTTNYCCEYFAL
jgi:hypothetical protein